MRYTPVPTSPGTAPITYRFTVDARGAGGPVRSALHTGAAVLGTLCIVLTLVAVLLGVRPLVVQSGSMAPRMPTGSLALTREVPATELRRGDVVSVQRADGARVTHRVHDLAGAGPRRHLTLRGDANGTVDRDLVTVTTVDRVMAHVPALGGWLAHLTTPPANFLLGALSGAAALSAQLSRRSPRLGRWVPCPSPAARQRHGFAR